MPGTLTKNEPATKTKPESAGSLLPIQEFPFFLSQLRDEFDRMFDRFVSGLPEMAFPSTNRWRWGMEVKDEDTAIVIRAEAPGFEPNDIEVQVQDGQLSVRAVRKIEKKEGNREEMQRQEFYHVMSIPMNVKKEQVEAKYHNGMLIVRLPKTAESKSVKVPVLGTKN